MSKIKKYIFGNKKQKAKVKNNMAKELFGKNTVFLVGAGIMGYVILKNMSYSGSSKKSSPAKNPAFTYPQGTPLTDTQEDELRNAILSNLGINPKEGSMQDGSKMTEQIHAQAVTDINAAMAYYPDTSNQKSTERALQEILNDLIQYKDQLVAAPEGVGMGPISGFSGVY